MVHSHLFQGLSPSLHLSGGFSVLTHCLRPVPGDTRGDPGRQAPGSGAQAVLMIY